VRALIVRHRVGVPFMQQLEKRWESRQSGLEPVTVTGSVLVKASPIEVWKFLADPRSALLIDPKVIKAFHVPGTPVAEAGSQQCMLMNISGRLVAHISEAIAVDAPHRTVTRWLTMPTAVLSTVLLAEDQYGTAVTFQIGMRVETGTGRKTEAALADSIEDELQRIRAAIESGARFDVS
jgi:hypothetical protein